MAINARIYRTNQDFARTYRKTNKSTEEHTRSNRRQCITKQDSTKTYRTLQNCIILYDIIQDLARPYGPYTTKEDYRRP